MLPFTAGSARGSQGKDVEGGAMTTGVILSSFPLISGAWSGDPAAPVCMRNQEWAGLVSQELGQVSQCTHTTRCFPPPSPISVTLSTCSWAAYDWKASTYACTPLGPVVVQGPCRPLSCVTSTVQVRQSQPGQQQGATHGPDSRQSTAAAPLLLHCHCRTCHVMSCHLRSCDPP